MANEEPKPDLCPNCGTPLGGETTCPTCGWTKDARSEAMENQRETRHGQDPQEDSGPSQNRPD